MIKFYILISISLSVFLSSCLPYSEERPKNLIVESKFKEIAIDLHLLEVFVEKEYKKMDSSKIVFNTLEQEIYKKHNVTEENYRNSYNYYMRNTDQMDVLYEEIVDSLGKMVTQTKVKKQMEKQKTE